MSTWLVMAVAEAVAALVGFVVGRYWDSEEDGTEGGKTSDKDL